MDAHIKQVYDQIIAGNMTAVSESVQAAVDAGDAFKTVLPEIAGGHDPMIVGPFHVAGTPVAFKSFEIGRCHDFF